MHTNNDDYIHIIIIQQQSVQFNIEVYPPSSCHVVRRTMHSIARACSRRKKMCVKNIIIIFYIVRNDFVSETPPKKRLKWYLRLEL